MTRPAGPFAAPPERKKPTVKRHTPDEENEKRHVRRRDVECIAYLLMTLPDGPSSMGICHGPLDVDHVRASGGLGMKSPTHRTNMVVLCRWHHRLKTEYGKVWRPLLIAYLERVEG